MKLRMPSAHRLATYAEAVALFEKARERRAGTTGSGTHKLPGHETPFTGMSRDGDNIRFHYHYTIVVTWRPDDTCMLDLSYQSMSTAEFANRFGPGNTWVESECRQINARSGAVTRGHYLVGNSGIVRLNVDGTLTHPEEDTKPWKVRRVNRKKANAAMRESGAKDFAEWYKVMSAALKDPWQHNSADRIYDIVGAVADREQWATLLKTAHYGYRITPPTFLAKLRATIYDDFDCHYIETHAFAPNWSKAHAWSKYCV